MIKNPTEEQLKTLTWIVYMVENKLNQMKYIGQSYRTFRKRYRTKKNWWKYSHNEYLKRAIDKYGIGNFTITILEYDVLDEEWLDNIETFYIKKYDCMYPKGYNFDDGGGTNRKWCQAAIDKKLTRTYKIKDKNGNIYEFNNGLKFCREHNLNTGDFWRMLKGSQLNTKGFSLIETDTRIQRRDRGNNGLVILKDKNGEIYEIYDLSAFCKKYNLNIRSINGVIQGEQKTNKGWRLPETPLDFEQKIGNKKWKKIILEKDGEIFEVENAQEFAKQHNFHSCAISNMSRGKLTVVKGFKLKSIIYLED